MKRYAKPITEVPKQEVAAETLPPSMTDVSVVRLIDDGLIALQREMKNILRTSASGKLDPASARDLRDHMKLLFELKKMEEDSLRHMSDEQLRTAAKKTLNESTETKGD